MTLFDFIPMEILIDRINQHRREDILFAHKRTLLVEQKTTASWLISSNRKKFTWLFSSLAFFFSADKLPKPIYVQRWKWKSSAKRQ